MLRLTIWEDLRQSSTENDPKGLRAALHPIWAVEFMYQAGLNFPVKEGWASPNKIGRIRRIML